MKDYIKVRMECEEFIHASGLNASILRPWYVLGPGHRWPYALIPFYKLMEKIPSTAESAKRLGLVTIRQLLTKLIYIIEHPDQGIRIIEVPEIRNGFK
jgi:nucleoside-diphosphate-sugar epimerase